MKHSEIAVSDNAVLRYLERVKGIDVAAIRADIKDKVAIASDHDAPCGVVSGGFTYKLRDGVVTTVAPANRPNIRTNRKRHK